MTQGIEMTQETEKTEMTKMTGAIESGGPGRNLDASSVGRRERLRDAARKAWRGPFSIRRRISASVTALLLAGLVAVDLVTYLSVSEFLSERLDAQIAAARAPIERYLSNLRPGGCASENALDNLAQPSAYIILYHIRIAFASEIGEPLRLSRCTLVNQEPFPSGSGSSPDPAPALPAAIHFSHPVSGRVYDPRIADANLSSFEVGAVGDRSFRYRVQAVPLPDGASMVAAAPLAPTETILSDLLRIEVAVSFAAIVILAGLAMAIVRLGLRPLESMARQAEAVAAGDLSRRVEPSDPTTETGRLGASLNVMLARIESAFAQREASEARLRRFIADVSHELRTPLTSIRGYAELFRRAGKSRPEEVERAMARIESEAARMAALVDDLLLLARLDQGRELERQEVDLVAVASDAVADASVLDPDREVRFVHDGEVSVLGDENRLRQLVANLVSNALTHTPSGTPVAVSVLRRDGKATIEVWDEGPVIPPEVLPQIFERFRTGAGSGNGSPGAGIGLSIVRAIAQAHGGKVWATSSPEEGTTFHVELETAH